MSKPKDFTPTEFVGRGENLVMDSNQENFYLVNETEYDKAESEDELRCEVLYPVESNTDIKYFRHKPVVYVILKRKDIQSVLLQ